MGGNIDGLHGLIKKFDRENIDGYSLGQPVFAIQLENIKRVKFDGSLPEHQICQYSPIKFCIIQYMLDIHYWI